MGAHVVCVAGGGGGGGGGHILLNMMSVILYIRMCMCLCALRLLNGSIHTTLFHNLRVYYFPKCIYIGLSVAAGGNEDIRPHHERGEGAAEQLSGRRGAYVHFMTCWM